MGRFCVIYSNRLPQGVWAKLQGSNCILNVYPTGYVWKIAIPSYPYSSTLRGIAGILLCVTAGKVPPPETAQLYFCTLARRGYPPVSAASDTFVRYTGRGTLHFAWYPLLSPDLVIAQGLAGI
jgi:hypothetical protein